MKVTNVEKKEKSTVELTIQVEAQEFEDAVQKAYLKNRAHISVPGCTAPACFMRMPSISSTPAPMRKL